MIKAFFFILIASIALSCNKPDNLQGFLNRIPDAKVESLNDEDSTRESFKIIIRQRLDHFGSDTTTFSQKIYLSHIDLSKPVVIVTEGYSANSNYLSEPAKLLKANQIIVEHRYFGESIPDSLQWKYLNIKQAAEDHHKIIELFKKFYKTKWVSTGISKGGQTTLYHRYFYPNDVNVSIPYVAPINFSKEEPRVYDFLKQVGTESCRTKILDFQKLLLRKKKELLPRFETYAKNNNLTFSMGYETSYEYLVLEFSFAFWQWGDLECDSIPSNEKDLDLVFNAFAKVGFSFFSDESIETDRPFFYQALTEIGFYSYDVQPFGDLIKVVKKPNFRFTLPEGVDTTYYFNMMRDVNQFLQNQGNNIIYIYGEFDPWSASAVELLPGKTNALKMVKQAGSHTTRIRSFDEAEKEKIYSRLEEWLGVQIERGSDI